MLKLAVIVSLNIADNPLGPNVLMSTGRPHHYGHLLQVQNESLQPLTLYSPFHVLMKISLKSDFIHFFMILYMYIAPGQGLTTP